MPALFEILTGHYHNGRPVAAAMSMDDLLVSIQDHLNRLLNARQGSLRHLPDYGLPDITCLYSGLPYSTSELTGAITRCIETYEPRLTDVIVIARPLAPGEGRLQLDITARLTDGSTARFKSYILREGQAEVIGLTEVDSNA